jgi:putative transposase
MSDKEHKREDEQAIRLALFRYGVIAPLLEAEDPEPGDVARMVRQISQQKHYLPGTGPVEVSQRTVYQWARDYRQGGIEALTPAARKDRGTSRVIPPEVLDRAVELRKEGPKRRTKTIVDILRREGRFSGPPPHRSTFDRHLEARGASRRQLKVLGTNRTIKMEFDNFGDLWVGDYHHGPLVLGFDGTLATSKLGAFIDHSTRYPVAHRYYLSENLGTLRDTYLRALLRWGPPRKTYVDRGAVYRSDQFAYSLELLDIKLIHSRAYYSQGRGVIEKWWQVAIPFEDEVRLRDELLTIHQLNSLWEAYCELNYCQAVHSELGRTPNEAIAQVNPRPVDPQTARECFLVRLERTVHRKDGCVAVEGRRFLCDTSLRGRKVQVRFDPADLSSVLIYLNGKRIQRASLQVPNARPEPPPEPQQLQQSVDYLQLLRQDYDRQLLEHARPMAYATLSHDPEFDLQQFLGVVSGLSGVKLQVSVRAELEEFWRSYGPLPEALVRIGVEHAVRLHGRGRHARIYLHAVRTLVLAHWRNPDKENS